ncbi:MAG: GIY-YIG nuclease family protein [Microbacterium sp.]
MEHALRIAYVGRAHLGSLPIAEWEVPGVYILLTGDGSGNVYIGSARRLRGRLGQHNSKEKLPWTRAVVVKRDTTDGFNTAEIGYLEGRVSAEIAALDRVTVIQGQASGDETLPKHMMLSLDSFVKSILAALRLTGVDTTRSNPEQNVDDVVTHSSPGRVTFNAKFADLVSSGLVRGGETLHLRQGAVEATGTVTSDGEIIVRGVTYRSPSAAAASALRLQSSNGWTAWHVGTLTGPTLDALRQQWLTQQSTEVEK